MHNSDRGLALILRPLIDYLFPKFGADFTFVILISVGFLFYVVVYGGYIFSIYQRQNKIESNIGFWEIVVQEVKTINVVKIFFILAFGIMAIYYFYRMLLTTVYDYPLMPIMNSLGMWVNKQQDLSYITYFSVGAILLVVILYLIGLVNKNK